MGVYIKGMKMPFTCLTCDFHKCAAGVGDFCSLTKRRQFRFKNRPKDCPFVPVPPHGRLIDADALMETFRERKRPTLSDGEDGSKERVRYIDFISTLQAIKDAPTIIPAEEGE